MLEALAVQLADGSVFFLEGAHAARQRIGDLELVARLGSGARLAVVKRGLHLLDGINQALGLVGQRVLLLGDLLQLAVQRSREGREQLAAVSSAQWAAAGAGAGAGGLPLLRESRAHGWERQCRRRGRAAGR